VSARVVVSLLAGAYLAAHLSLLAPSLEDIDSINFALGLRQFDIGDHRPHPPGYPVFMALGRVARHAIGAAAPSLPAVRAEALALAFWSALGGAIAFLAARSVFGAMSGGETGYGPSFWAAVLLATAPVSWLTAQRPMSDTAGFAAALVAQALIVGGARNRRRLVLGALAAGLAAGLRAQTVWLTMPVLGWAIVEHRRLVPATEVSTGLPAGSPARNAAVALAAGALAWAIPLVTLSGGIAAYVDAFRSQASEDLAFVDMVWADPTPRRIAYALRDTLVLPWTEPALATVVALVAAVGAFVLVRRERRSLALLLVAFGPYAVFHVLFQETFHTRYALPVVALVVWPAARGVATLGRWSPLAGTAIAGWALWVVLPASLAYGREPHPAFRAMGDMARAAPAEAPSAIHSHYSVRRPLQADHPAGIPLVEPPRTFEWLGLVNHWRQGGDGRVWFLADPRRSDLELIDPQSRRDVTRYGWSVAGRPELGGVRPVGVDWYRFERPGWVASEGWSLTPETGGVAHSTGRGIDRRPITALVRRRAGPIHIVIGGAVLVPEPSGALAFELSLDGTVVERWPFDPRKEGPTFLRFIDVPAGVPPGSGDYATLAVAARPEPGGPTFPVAIRQFDLQSADTLIHGFGEGWHELEYENASGRRWRWTSPRAVLRIRPSRAVELTLVGESPLRYFDAAPTVRITAGGRTMAEFHPADAFEWRVAVPADAVAAGGGAIVVETDRVYHPAEAEGTADRRMLSLRLFDVGVAPVGP
jgi:hypothetical protein